MRQEVRQIVTENVKKELLEAQKTLGEEKSKMHKAKKEVKCKERICKHKEEITQSP